MNEATAESVAADPYRPAQHIVDETDLTWRVLGTLNVFRLLVAALLLALFFATVDPRFFGDRYPGLFAATASGYLVFAIVVGLAIRQRWVPAGPLIYSQVVVDIAAIVILLEDDSRFADISEPTPDLSG